MPTRQDDGFLHSKRYLIVDGDKKFTDQFKRILEDAGVEVVRIAFQAPNMNAFAERWVKSVKTECVGRLILFGQDHLERVLREYAAHYHAERPHQGLGNELIEGEPAPGDGDVIVNQRLGGLLRSYSRAA